MKHLTGNRGWDGWMASLTQWTWVWANWEIVEDREAWCAIQHGVTKNGTWLSNWTMTTAFKWEPPKFHCLTYKPDPWCLSSRNLLSKTTYYQKKTLYKREFRNVIGGVKNVLGVQRGSLSIKSGRLPEGEFMLNFGRGGGESQVLWSAHRLYYFREEEWGMNKWTLSALKMSLLHAPVTAISSWGSCL